VLATVNQIGLSNCREDVEKAIAPVLRTHLGGAPSLALIASWAQHVAGSRKAVDFALREAFAISCQPGPLHQQLAGIEGTKLYVTTNYDDLLEQALAPRQPHLIVDRGEKGLWVGVAGEKLQPVASTGNELYDLLNDPESQAPSRPIIFKMHGSVDKGDPRNDSYLITEEDYVDFLSRTSGSYIPPYLMGLMEGKAFLFLGYSLEDWNVRVILRKLLKPPKSDDVRCWAVVRGRGAREQEVWQARDLNVYPMDLSDFAVNLKDFL
jgi:SIR2-like domain